MHFKSLELYGFKSFAGRTKIDFEPGVTAIVGPNGVGKSNILDSLKWVLGEQSAKDLRGSNMEDVIFNGTDTKDPVGFAEVSLTLSNETKFLPIEYDEVVITRRLFRSGDSEYLLNKNQVRLKDILELFMGTGVGTNAYSVIEQGKIDMLISSRPEDRRYIFEEASGIIKYKSKKREAIRKLEYTENNILRANDITEEVRRQIGSIERQAKKAQRYKEEFERLKALDTRVAFLEFTNLNEEKESLEKQAAALKNEEEALLAGASGLSSRLGQLKAKEAALMARLSEAQFKEMNLISHIERSKDKQRLNEERYKELEALKQSLLNEQTLAQKAVAELEEMSATLSKETQAISGNKAEKEDLLGQKREALKRLEEELRRNEQGIRAGRLKLVDVLSLHSKTRNDLTKLSSDISNLQARERRLKAEKEGVDRELTVVKAQFDQLDGEVNGLGKKVGDNRRIQADLESRVTRKEAELAEIEKRLGDIKARQLSLESRLVLLKDMARRYEGFGSGSKALLVEKGENSLNIADVFGAAAELIEVKKGYEAAAEAALNGLLECIVIENRDAATDLINCLKAKTLGRILIVPLDLIVLNWRQQIQETEIEVAGLEQEAANQSALKDAITKEGQALLDEINACTEALRQDEILLANKNAQRQTVEASLKKISDEASLLRLELEETGDELNALRIRQSACEAELKRLDEENDNVQAGINAAQDFVEKAASVKEGLLVETARLETELANVAQQERSLLADLKMRSELLANQKALIGEKQKGFSDASLRQEELRKEIDLLQTAVEEAAVENERLSIESQDVRSNKSELANLLAETEKAFKEKEAALSTVKDRLHESQMRSQENSFKSDTLKTRIIQAYKVGLEGLALDIEEGFNVDAANGEIVELREKLDRMGPVNLVAIEEHQELKERFDFLNRQREDLLNAKESLLEAIKKINRTTRELFMDTFQKVRVEFKEYFRFLFGGGQAEIVLMDEQDVLECGIEIMARPPGKKLQSISLLSGGEKALTAIALLFSIFKVKPSPFCILDEVDAPLDESNIGRFIKLLSDFTKTSQFIIITHNKKTISMADVMYGITMEQNGVSKVVSVKFAKEEVGAVPRTAR